MQSRMARYDVHNDGSGPYAIFYCDKCGRQFRSQPNVTATVAKEITRSAFTGLFRNVPILGDAVDSIASSTDPKSSTTLSAQQLNTAWSEMQSVFHQCPVCLQLVCPTDWDAQASLCMEDASKKRTEAQASATDVVHEVKCVSCGADVRGAKFCRECGTAVATKCRSCGAETGGAKFCPECGAKQSA